MTTSVDLLLAAVAITWLLQASAILASGVANQRRVRRQRGLQQQLAAVPAGSANFQLPRRLSLHEFHALSVAGVPREVESTVAAALRDRIGGTRLRRWSDADGSAVWRRIAALQVLASCRDPYAYALLDRAVRSSVPRVATAALRMLVRLDDRTAADVLLRALRDGSYTRSRVASAFERLTTPRRAMIDTLFDADNPELRAWGARLAGRLREEALAPRVRDLLDDPNDVVRRAAVEAIGAIGDAQDRDRLRARLLDPSPIVRAHAARALALHADERSIEAVADRLADREWIVRAAARDTLSAQGGDSRAALIRTLWGDDPFAAENAADLLQRLGMADDAARRLLRSPESGATGIPMLRQVLAAASGPARDAFLGRFPVAEREQLLLTLREGQGFAGTVMWT